MAGYTLTVNTFIVFIKPTVESVLSIKQIGTLKAGSCLMHDKNNTDAPTGSVLFLACIKKPPALYTLIYA
jgi:hypothetical protein